MAYAAIAQIAAAVIGYANQTRDNKAQSAWNQYNAGMQYNTDMFNVASGLAMANINAGLAMKAAEINANMQQQLADYNSEIVKATALYNDQLAQEELSLMWDAMDLDLTQLENQRAVERGQIVGQQASSGVVIGDGSTADVVIDSMTQQALDETVVRYNADVKAAQIGNARAQSLWDAEMQINQIQYEGQMNSWNTMANARLQAAGTLATAGIQAIAGSYSANQRYSAGMHGAQLQQSQQQSQIGNNFVNGMFSAASTYTSNYYKYKTPQTPTSATGGSVAASAKTSYKAPGTASPRVANPQYNSLSTPGGSLMSDNTMSMFGRRS